ncbi:MAG: tyrosine-type recombinase/integrase [Phycisphaerae bacterium]|nr:tyrosine-type recombinase/integrase [Phycisphaerae bacterium]
MILPSTVEQYLTSRDFSPHTQKAIRADLRKFAAWFVAANNEPFNVTRITVADLTAFRDHLVGVRRQAVASVNRALVSLRRFLGHLVQSGELPTNPAIAVKELRRVPLAPKGLTAAQIRRIMREIEIRQDVRAGAIIALMALGGLRVSDVVGLDLQDVVINPRSGSVICRHGKGNKQRVVPLCREARRLLTAYLEVRPPTAATRVFIGERGPLTDDGVRAICERYAATCGVDFTPHRLRHAAMRGA